MALLSQELVLGGAEVEVGRESQTELLTTHHAQERARLTDGQRRPCGASADGRGAGHQLVEVHLSGGHQVQQEERVSVHEGRLGARPARQPEVVLLHRRLRGTADDLNDPLGPQLQPTGVPAGHDEERLASTSEPETLGCLRDRCPPRRQSSSHCYHIQSALAKVRPL